jgi:hypothetical protein
MFKSLETGHAKNMANLETLIAAIGNFGEKYNPSKESIKPDALEAILKSTKEAFDAFYVAQSVYANAVDARTAAFQPIGKLVTRINNALKASDSSTLSDQSFQTIIRKLQGRRASAKLTDEEKQTLASEGKSVNQISTAQMGYESRLENFDKLIIHLSTIPAYKPNEEELKLDTLKTLYTQLKAANTAVISAFLHLDKARATRNEILYHPLTGVVDLASDAKTYIKSAFGSSSSEYKEVSKLIFENRI